MSLPKDRDGTWSRKYGNSPTWTFQSWIRTCNLPVTSTSPTLYRLSYRGSPAWLQFWVQNTRLQIFFLWLLIQLHNCAFLNLPLSISKLQAGRSINDSKNLVHCINDFICLYLGINLLKFLLHKFTLISDFQLSRPVSSLCCVLRALFTSLIPTLTTVPLAS